MTYHVKVIAGGKVVIPAELRRAFGIKDGDTLVLEPDGSGESFVCKTFRQVVREEQQAFRAEVGPGYSVDQFLSDRRVDGPEE